MPTLLAKPTRITAGVFIQAPPKEVVNVATDVVADDWIAANEAAWGPWLQ